MSFILILGALSLLLGLYLIMFYFKRFLPTVRMHNPQIIGVIFLTIAACFRFMFGVASIAIGPSVESTYYYTTTAMFVFLQLTYGLFYPLTLSALALQVVIWMELVVSVKTLKTSVSSWLPRLKWIFIGFCVVIFALEITVDVLLIRAVEVPLVLMIYRVFLALFILLLLLISVISAIRLHLVLSRVKNSDLLAPSSQHRATQARKAMTRVMLLACAFLLVGLVMALVHAFIPYTYTIAGYFSFNFILRAVEYGFLLSVMMNFRSLMRNRIAFVTGALEDDTATTGEEGISSGSSSRVSKSSSQRSKSARKAGSQVVAQELKTPLMDYSNFGSMAENDDSTSMTVELSSIAPGPNVRSSVKMGQPVNSSSTALLDTAMADGSDHVYQQGELVWAQYRMDGLWYAARVSEVNRDLMELEYVDYDMIFDTLPRISVCPDYLALLAGDRADGIRAFDCRPSQDLVAAAKAQGLLEPDTFGFVRLRSKSARKPNHQSLLHKRTK